jgi:nucleoside 2-deoxyribosyltransferase
LPSLSDAISQLAKIFRAQFELQQELDRITDEESGAVQQERLEPYSQQIVAKRREVRQYLEANLLRFPPSHFAEHSEKLKEFFEIGSYEKSVFVMTKFPESDVGDDAKLKAIIEEVKKAIADAGMIPRIGTFEYHEELRRNVELYLLGSAKGVAIVEDRCRKEMNPNVAFEWGWMKGMGKRVFYLMEEGFAHSRADWSGLLNKTFSWDNPLDGIRTALTAWLTQKEKPLS